MLSFDSRRSKLNRQFCESLNKKEFTINDIIMHYINFFNNLFSQPKHKNKADSSQSQFCKMLFWAPDIYLKKR